MADTLIIGGGAAGVFAAISAKTSSPLSKVILLEKSAYLLSKVKISGGGRCNVTHACFDPVHLSQNYPRGSKELIGPFTRFGPKEIIEWFESRNVPLKIESDGRIFPVSDRSETIIACLLGEAEKLGVIIHSRVKIQSIRREEDEFLVDSFRSKKLILATGSSPEGYEVARSLGHTIISPVPSLFTFNVPTSPLKDLSGLSLEAEVSISASKLFEKGPLLITHFGFSGPVILKLSAFGARMLHERKYETEIAINFLPGFTEDEIKQKLHALKDNFPEKKLTSENIFHLPKRLWHFFAPSEKKLSEISKKELLLLSAKLNKSIFKMEGKTTHKEEFVTAGGVDLKEINFKTMESKIISCLFFAGEILDIDGVTGGFNFQNAWTTGYIAGS